MIKNSSDIQNSTGCRNLELSIESSLSSSPLFHQVLVSPSAKHLYPVLVQATSPVSHLVFRPLVRLPPTHTPQGHCILNIFKRIWSYCLKSFNGSQQFSEYNSYSEGWVLAYLWASSPVSTYILLPMYMKMEDVLSIPCSFMPLWLHQNCSLCPDHLPHLLPGFAYSFNKIQFKCHCLQEAFCNPLVSAPTTPACFPWVTMVCSLVCFSPKADLPRFTWFTFVLPLLGILPGTQETVNKCMSQVFES